MVGKRFDSHRRSVCIARSLIAGEGGGGRREEVDRIGQRPTSNFIRNRPSVKLCPIENRYFILAELSAVLRDDGEDRQIFLWSGSAQRKNFYQTCTVSSIISDGRGGGDYVRSARVERSGRFSRTRERFG